MPFYDFFRNFFVGRRPTQEPPQHRIEDDQQCRDSFRNPIWQNDDEDDGEVNDFSSRQPRTRYQFRVFSDPFEMTRFFETQIDDIMRNFFGGFDGFGNLFGSDGNIFSNALPAPDEVPDTNGPLDEVLKPEVPDSQFPFDSFTNVLPVPDRKYSGKSPRDEVLKPAYEMPSSSSKKVDSDIDGKIKSDELAKIWKTPSSSAVDTYTAPPPAFSFRSFGSSMSTRIVRRADGSVEQHKTVRDSEGNEETTVTRQIGDKVHTVVSKRAKDGTEEKTEDIVNMNESDLKGFDERWQRIEVTPKEESGNFPWHKFFGPNPKL